MQVGKKKAIVEFDNTISVQRQQIRLVRYRRDDPHKSADLPHRFHKLAELLSTLLGLPEQKPHILDHLLDHLHSLPRDHRGLRDELRAVRRRLRRHH